RAARVRRRTAAQRQLAGDGQIAVAGDEVEVAAPARDRRAARDAALQAHQRRGIHGQATEDRRGLDRHRARDATVPAAAGGDRAAVPQHAPGEEDVAAIDVAVAGGRAGMAHEGPTPARLPAGVTAAEVDAAPDHHVAHLRLQRDAAAVTADGAAATAARRERRRHADLRGRHLLADANDTAHAGDPAAGDAAARVDQVDRLDCARPFDRNRTAAAAAGRAGPTLRADRRAEKQQLARGQR